MKKLLLYMGIQICIIISCKSLEEISPKIDVSTLKTEKGNAVDSAKSTTITANGATINVPLAGAKIIVPAGAMSPGAVLVTQTITDKLDNDGNGLRISGDFLKPFTVEFNYPSDEKNPENLGIGIQSQNGNWYMLKKYVINKSARTIGFSIYPRKTKNARLNGAKLLTNDYDLAFAKQFYLRAEKTEVDLGESVNIKAYARQGVIPNSDKFKEYRSEWENGDFPMSLAEYIDSQEIAIKNKDEEQAADPDKLMPLVQVAQEYLFANKKEGYRRSWILTEGVGSLEATGNIGAKYTAPKTNDAAGKIAIATFYSSLETDLKGGIEASVRIRIKDGLIRYVGTIKTEFLWKRNNETEIINAEFKGILVNSSFKNIFHEDPLEIETTISNYSFTNSKSIESEILASITTETSKDVASLLLLVDEKTAKYRISGWIQCNKAPIIGTFINGEKYNETRTIGVVVSPEPVSNTAKYYDFGDGKTLTGTETISHQYSTTKTTWNLKKIE